MQSMTKLLVHNGHEFAFPSWKAQTTEQLVLVNNRFLGGHAYVMTYLLGWCLKSLWGYHLWWQG